MMHSFNVQVANEVGVNKAILLNNIDYWVRKNKANDMHLHEGFYYTYNSYEAFATLFPYMIKSSIKRSMQELEKDGLIKSAKLSDNPWDKTKFYTLTSKYYELMANENLDDTVPSMGQILPIDRSDVTHLYTDINPDVKQKKVYSPAVHSTYQEVLEYFGRRGRPVTETQVSNWLEVIDKLHRIDNWEFDEIEQITKAARDDNFWSSNFMSLLKLRKKDSNGTMYIQRFEPLVNKSKPKAGKMLKDSWL